MTDERLDDESIVRRCILDFARRGGINEDNAVDVAKAIVGSLAHLGSAASEIDRLRSTIANLQQVAGKTSIDGQTFAQIRENLPR